MRVYQQRLLKKHWQNKWPQLQFLKFTRVIIT